VGIPDGIISYKREGILIQSIFAPCLNKTFVRNSSIAHLSVILDVFKHYFSNCNRIKIHYRSHCTAEERRHDIASYFAV
jgi:hypothetical protein